MKKKGWKEWKPKNVPWKWTIIEYESPDWKEWISLRDFDSSWWKWTYDWYTMWATMEFSKSDWHKLKAIDWEIKFIFPK